MPSPSRTACAKAWSAGWRKRTGALVVALRKQDGTFDTTPTPEARVDVGDVLIATGTTEELRALEDLFAPRESIAR